MEIYFESYGCANNTAETEIMKGILTGNGCNITNNTDIADVLIINTCIVKGPTINKMIRRIQDLSKLRKPLIVAGCMPAVMEKEVLKLNPKASLISTQNIDKIAYTTKKTLEGTQIILTDYNQPIKLNKPRIRKNPKVAIIPISSGCNNYCSYCIVRLAKGKLYSFPEQCILKEVRDSLSSGAKEIWITSQDNASYGLDKGERKFPELLKKILDLKGRFQVRVGMMNPENILPILDDLIEIYNHKKMKKFLHIPVQSGSDSVLKSMNRKYSVSEFLKIINKFRKEIPDLFLSTDIIVGFPGETEKDFEKSLELIRQIKPNMLNSSKFWKMKGTEAEKMRQLPPDTIKNRVKKLVDIYKNLKSSN